MHRAKPRLPNRSLSSAAGVAALAACLAFGAAPAEAAPRRPRAVRGANLQAALDAAMPGDRIVVKGVVTGGVTGGVTGTVRGDEAGEIQVWTPGITIDARRATLRARIVVRADDVRIEGARFRDARLLAFGDRIEVRGARVLRGTLSVTGAGVVADGNRLDGRGVTSQAIEIAGDDSSVTENDVRSFVSPVLATGDRLDVSGNVVRTTTVSGATACAFLVFDAAVIDACTVTGCTMGIVNLAAGTEIAGSIVTGNGTGAANLDVIDLGSVVIGEGTTVGHLVIDAAAFPEFVDLRTTGYRPLETPSALR